MKPDLGAVVIIQERFNKANKILKRFEGAPGMAKIGPGVEARKRRIAAPTTAGSAAQNERTNERVGGGGLGDGYTAFS